MQNEEEEIRKLRNAYAREWRNKNKDRVKAINARFYKRLKIKNEQENRKDDTEWNWLKVL